LEGKGLPSEEKRKEEIPALSTPFSLFHRRLWPVSALSHRFELKGVLKVKRRLLTPERR